MNFAHRYISKNILFDSFVQESPNKNLELCVVIPCYNEPFFIDTLHSLCRSANSSDCSIEILVVLNSEEGVDAKVYLQNQKTLVEILQFKDNFDRPDFKVHPIQIENVRSKWAGAGYARKVGMDEAVRRFSSLGWPDGVIVSLDADCIVEENYFSEICKHSRVELKVNFWTLYFEHPLDLEDKTIESGIVLYELHMRYYRQCMQWSGYPNAIHTVGSAFAVRVGAYVKQGGMNRRKAGEDFYFLHKLIMLGDFSEINSTTVMPASRLSNRVPFGTGPTLQSWVDGVGDLTQTYSFDSFHKLRPFFSSVSQLFSLSKIEIEKLWINYDEVLQQFLNDTDSVGKILSLQDNCAKEEVFSKRFFIEFDAFFILQFLNFWHRRNQKQSLFQETDKLLDLVTPGYRFSTTKEQLLHLREFEKKKTK